MDALDQGFTGVDGQLLAAHDLDRVRPGRTLESLYLKPLAQRRQVGSDAALRTYAGLLTTFTGNGVRGGHDLRQPRPACHGGAEGPLRRVRRAAQRPGGRHPATLIPLISDN